MTQPEHDNPYVSPTGTSEPADRQTGNMLDALLATIFPVIGMAFTLILTILLVFNVRGWFNGILMLAILLCQVLGILLTIFVAFERKKSPGTWHQLRIAMVVNLVSTVLNVAGFLWLLQIVNSGFHFVARI